ncbi:hypothetical protein D3C72_2464590 [compost metagenome]
MQFGKAAERILGGADLDQLLVHVLEPLFHFLHADDQAFDLFLGQSHQSCHCCLL